MAKLEDDVREIILARYGNVARFARTIGIPKHTVYSALSKGLANTTLSTIVPICKALDIEPYEILEGRLTYSNEQPKPVFVPLYDGISVGNGADQPSTADIFPIPAELHSAHPDAFMVRVKGNSMNRILPDGHLVLVQPCDNVDTSGQICLVMVGGQDAIMRRVILHDNGLTLQPDSNDPTYKPRLVDYSEDDAPDVRIFGHAVWSCGLIDK